HRISPTSWVVTFQCSSYEPSAIAQVAEETGDLSSFAWRLDTDGSVTTADNPVGDIYIGVISTGPVWTTDPDDYPMYLDIGGVRVRCTGSLPPSGNFQNLIVDPLPVPIPAGTPV